MTKSRISSDRMDSTGGSVARSFSGPWPFIAPSARPASPAPSKDRRELSGSGLGSALPSSRGSIVTEPWALKLFRKSPLKRDKVKALLSVLGPVEGKRCLDLGSDNG